jgi:hypothetical protein
MWHVAQAGLEPDGELLVPIYLDLRRYRGDDDLLTLVWSTIAETGTKTFHPDVIRGLLEHVPSLVFLDDLGQALHRHPETSITAINTFLETFPRMRAVFAAESDSYEGQFPQARHYMLMSVELEKATSAMPRQVGDVIVAIIGDNASNIAIGRDSSATSVDVAAETITSTQSRRGEEPEVDYKLLSELVGAARDQDWDKVESITQEVADTIGESTS